MCVGIGMIHEHIRLFHPYFEEGVPKDDFGVGLCIVTVVCTITGGVRASPAR